VNSLYKEYGYPIEAGCAVLELPRSTYYYAANPPNEQKIVEMMRMVAGQFPTYGKRRMCYQLRREPYHLHLNHKRVARIMRANGLLQPAKRRKYRTTNSAHPFPRFPNRLEGLVVDHPDQVWVADITYIRLAHGFAFLAILMDVFTRVIRGWCLSHSLDQRLTQVALEHGLQYHCPEIHHSDQGFQYATRVYTAMLRKHHIQISMAAVGKPEENGYAERWMRTIKEEEVDLSEYRDFADAGEQIGRFIEDVYRFKRIHSALGYLTPAEFEADYWATKVVALEAPLSTP
jgi:putative transposase